jgi:hypothetical protein
MNVWMSAMAVKVGSIISAFFSSVPNFFFFAIWRHYYYLGHASADDTFCLQMSIDVLTGCSRDPVAVLRRQQRNTLLRLSIFSPALRASNSTLSDQTVHHAALQALPVDYLVTEALHGEML